MKKREAVKFRAHRELGVEHIAAAYTRHRFPPHLHRSYLIGLTLDGVEDIVQDGAQHRSLPGHVRTINPNVVHGGGCLDDHVWHYEAIYVPPSLLVEAGASIGLPEQAPHLVPPVLSDPVIAAALEIVFRRLEDQTEPLAAAEALATFLIRLVRTCVAKAPTTVNDPESAAVGRARDYLQAHALRGVKLETLAETSELSKFHLLRVFKAQTGLTPWQYQTQARIDAARALLSRGEPPSQVAAACGFVDQSHMTRIFRRVVGVTPAVFAADYKRAVTATSHKTN